MPVSARNQGSTLQGRAKLTCIYFLGFNSSSKAKLKHSFWGNSKCLEIEVKKRFTAVPNDRVLMGSYDPPQVFGFYKLGLAQIEIYEPMTSAMVNVAPERWMSSAMVPFSFPTLIRLVLQSESVCK
jgi:hypothetical protein